MAGDVASAYRNVCIHSEWVYMFAGHIPEDAVIVIDLAVAFGWTGSLGTYGVLGGAVAFAHGSTTNATHSGGFYNYHWVDYHINVTDDTGSNCADIDRSLRWAMTSIMGPAAVNDDKFTPWSTRLKVLGLIFDTTAETVSMPPEKIAKAKRLVSHAFYARNLARSEYRSLLGSLRHVTTCIRPARVFLQRLRAGERLLHRTRRIPVSDDMRDDLLWWWAILDSPTLNGIPLEYFDAHPIQDIIILTDASDEGICAIDPSASRYLTYNFSPQDLKLITAFHDGVANEFDINYRELLACAFAVLAWGPRWRQERAQAKTIHVHFRINNTTTVSWQLKMAARNS